MLMYIHDANPIKIPQAFLTLKFVSKLKGSKIAKTFLNVLLYQILRLMKLY